MLNRAVVRHLAMRRYLQLLTGLLFAWFAALAGAAYAQSFTLSAASPGYTSVWAGGPAATYGITITTSGGFNSGVALSASNVPTGVTISIPPCWSGPPTSGSTCDLTVSAAATATGGQYSITVTGTGGGVQASTTFTLYIDTFSISSSPTSVSVAQGSNGTSTITNSIPGSYPGETSVSLSASGQPAGVSISFSPTSLAAYSGSSSTMTLTVASNTTPGTYPITVTGTVNTGNGNVIQTTTVTLTVTSNNSTPTISGLSPTSAAVGSSVTITGVNFGANQGTSTVTFNGTAATISSWSNTSIVAVVPSGATTGNVVVTVGGAASNGSPFTVLIPPVIQENTGVSASTLAYNSNVTAGHALYAAFFDYMAANQTLTFSDSQGNTWTTVASANMSHDGDTIAIGCTVANSSTADTVSFYVNGSPYSSPRGMVIYEVGGTTCTPDVAPVSSNTTSATSCTSGALTTSTANDFLFGFCTSLAANTPTVGSGWSNGIGTAYVIGETQVAANTGAYTATSAGWATATEQATILVAFKPGAGAPTPTITSLSPTSGAVGSSVTITGTNFGSTQGSSTVKFNGTIATSISSWSNTSIVAVVPSGATTGNVVVTVGGVASNAAGFTVSPSSTPTISSLSPTSGAVGTPVTISGTNFGTTQGTSAVTFNGTSATITSWSTTSIVAQVPAGATTGNVVVTVGGVASNGAQFDVAPAITPPLSLPEGPVSMGITIAGSGFGTTQGTSTVTFNGTTATTVVSWSNTSIVVDVPAGATNGNVVVRVNGVASNGVSFQIDPPFACQ
jgi:IPT/TIG domain